MLGFRSQMATRPMLGMYNMRMFGGGAALRPSTPGGRIKVTDHIVWINVVPLDGVPRRVAGFKGESLLQVLERNHIPGIYTDSDNGDTEGSMQPH